MKSHTISAGSGFHSKQDQQLDRNFNNDHRLEIKPSKRRRPKLIMDIPEYYVMSHAHEEQDLQYATTYLIQKALTSSIGDGATNKRLSDGQLLIRCKNQRQSLKLLAMTSLGGLFPIKFDKYRAKKSVEPIQKSHLEFIPEAEYLGIWATKVRNNSVSALKFHHQVCI